MIFFTEKENNGFYVKVQIMSFKILIEQKTIEVLGTITFLKSFQYRHYEKKLYMILNFEKFNFLYF